MRLRLRYWSCLIKIKYNLSCTITTLWTKLIIWPCLFKYLETLHHFSYISVFYEVKHYCFGDHLFEAFFLQPFLISSWASPKVVQSSMTYKIHCTVRYGYYIREPSFNWFSSFKCPNGLNSFSKEAKILLVNCYAEVNCELHGWFNTLKHYI